MPNLGHVSVLERILSGDVMYDDAGLLDRTHLRFFTPRSVFKMLMDCGWLPSPAGGYRGAHANERYLTALYEAAQSLGISRAAAEYNLETYQLIILAKRWNQPRHAPHVDLTVVVSVTNELQCSLNIARSPGIKELDATLMLVRGARNTDALLAEAASRSQSEWFLVADESAYFPIGSGFLIAQEIRSSPGAVIGLSGTSADGRPAGVRCFAIPRSSIGSLASSAAKVADVPHLLNVQ